jgi:hypothetical protein
MNLEIVANLDSNCIFAVTLLHEEYLIVGFIQLQLTLFLVPPIPLLLEPPTAVPPDCSPLRFVIFFIEIEIAAADIDDILRSTFLTVG